MNRLTPRHLHAKNVESIDMLSFAFKVFRTKLVHIRKIKIHNAATKGPLPSFRKLKLRLLETFSFNGSAKAFLAIKAREIVKKTNMKKIVLELGPSFAMFHMDYFKSFLESLPKRVSRIGIHLGMSEFDDIYVHYFLPVSTAKQVSIQNIVVNTLERLRWLKKSTLYCLPMNANQVNGTLIRNSFSRNKHLKSLNMNPIWLTSQAIGNLANLEEFQPIKSLVLCCNLESMEKSMSYIGSFLSNFSYLTSLTISSIVNVSKLLMKLNPYQMRELEVDVADHLDLSLLKSFDGSLKHLSIYALEYSYGEEYMIEIPAIQSLESFKFILMNNHNLNCWKLGRQIAALKNLKSLHLELCITSLYHKGGVFFDGLDSPFDSLECFNLKMKEMESEIYSLANFLNSNVRTMKDLSLDFMSTNFSEKVANHLLETLYDCCENLKAFKFNADCRPFAMVNKKDAISKLITKMNNAERVHIDVGPGFFLTEKEILRIIEAIEALRNALEVNFVGKLNQIKPELRNNILKDIQSKINSSGVQIDIYTDWLLDQAIAECMCKRKISLMV